MVEGSYECQICAHTAICTTGGPTSSGLAVPGRAALCEASSGRRLVTLSSYLCSFRGATKPRHSGIANEPAATSTCAQWARATAEKSLSPGCPVACQHSAFLRLPCTLGAITLPYVLEPPHPEKYRAQQSFSNSNYSHRPRPAPHSWLSFPALFLSSH